ncbi:MAG: DUF2520 domain-containing protein [Bacteroidales bacterium]|nr:DUF2520 domain-containing protein [Bacteroidales bacterium]
MNNEIISVVIIGAGNLATNLGFALMKAGAQILQICNRTPERGKLLAKKTHAVYIDNIDKLTQNADLYICSVSDHALVKIIPKLHLKNKLVVHTSGTLGMDILKDVSSHYGVLYPLQTFIRSKSRQFKDIPVCIEGNNPATERKLKMLAEKLSNNVHVIESRKRKILHLSAVFAGNFTNFMYTIAEDLLNQYDLPLDLLHPLIVKISHNTKYHNLFLFQTGPAVREDRNIIEEHRILLKNDKLYQELYTLISNGIIQYKHSHDKL